MTQYNKHKKEKGGRDTDRIRKRIGELRHLDNEQSDRAAEIWALLMATLAVLDQKEITESLRHLLDACLSCIGAASGYCFSLDRNKDIELLAFDSRGPWPECEDLNARIVHEVKDQLIRRGEAISLNEPPEKADSWGPVVNILAVPIRGDHEISGGLGFANKRCGFGRDDIKLAFAFAEIAEVALRPMKRKDIDRETEALYPAILSMSPESITLSDLEGRIIMANERTVELHGFTCIKDIIGVSAFDFIAPEDQTRAVVNMKRTLQAERIECVEYTLKKCDGTSFPGELSASLLRDEEGNPKAFMAITRDISDRKRAEQEKRKLQEMLHNSQQRKALGQLAGGVAHDINNILTTITGVVSVLETRLEQQGIYFPELEYVLGACDRGHDLTRNFLGFAQEGTTQKMEVNLNETVRGAKKLLSRTLPKGITIRAQFDDDLPEVMADPDELTRAMVNLSLNAADAMGERGQLTFRTNTVEYNEEDTDRPCGLEPGRYVNLLVQDTGEGMDEETRLRAFEPFFTTKKVGDRTGLGLSMVYGMVGEHGGKVFLESDVGVGTQVSIFLPALEPKLEAHSNEREQWKVSRSPGEVAGTVLLVDDEELVLKSGKCVLEALGYSVLTAKNGKKALDLYKDKMEDIRFVLLDLMMPVMDGADTLMALKEINPQVKVFMASGFYKQDRANFLTSNGALGIVEKPYTLTGLEKQLTQALAGV